ncbi:histidinol dehydrogenase [candidate division NPL-UPA2 bacterium]|nr:histidinol dehydrogenase [candidate division NPL-UPA2 bacterium]
MKIIKSWQDKAALEKIVNRSSLDETVDETVRKIIEDVRRNGDRAVLKYTKKFDGISLKASQLRISRKEINDASRNMDKELVKLINSVCRNIIKFHKRELRTSWTLKKRGLTLGQRYHPLKRVGIYVPGGTAPLLSSLLMTAVPARVAGVPDIVMTSPPGKSGRIHPHLLAAAELLDINEIYRVGGAQAVAALAFGTETIPRVDKVIGPGNRYVVSALRQVFGPVGVGLLPGPSEVVILADGGVKASYVIADLKAQSEHEMGLAVLLTTSLRLAGKVEKEARGSYVIVTKSMGEAIQLINKIAPEHLEIMVKNPEKILKKIINSGTVFLGPWTPTAVGDYIAGPSHVLPTGGTARFSSGLAVDDFRRRSNIISYNREQLKKALKPLTKLAEIEGMPAHADSVKIRLDIVKNKMIKDERKT